MKVVYMQVYEGNQKTNIPIHIRRTEMNRSRVHNIRGLYCTLANRSGVGRFCREDKHT